MATCATIMAQDPFSRAPTPKPAPSSFRVVTKRTSYQSLNSPVMMSPVVPQPFSPLSPVEPEWPLINVISPSTASHHSLYSDGEDEFRPPRLALLTSDLDNGPEELNKLISPSAPVPQPGDELLYDMATEEKPDQPYFQPDFQSVLAKTKQEMKDIALAIWGCPASHQLGSDLHALKQRALELSEFEPAKSRTIGLVGDANAGKSGVINALLDQSHLAQSSTSNGHSVHVMTEYRFRPASHNEPFAVEVEYLSLVEVKELIQELLRTFRACYEPGFKDIEDFEERCRVRERSEIAWHTLHRMFRNQPTFSRAFVLAEAGNSIDDKLHIWASKFLASRHNEGSTLSATAFDAEECSDILYEFTHDPIDESKPAVWPFVRIVRVYLRAGILHSGVILVDCPAPRDLDYARARATERCIRNCHEVFVVAPMGIAITDSHLEDMVERNGRHRPLRIICTKSDDFDAREVERRDTEITLQVRTWRQQIESFRKQVKRSEAQRRHGIPGALDEEMRLRDMFEEMQFGLKKMLVERRNERVAANLIEQYWQRVQMGDLKVFCVSSQDYQDHRYDEQHRAESRVDLSGIPNLRQYLHSIPAEGHFEEASAFIEHDVPALLGSLHQWAVGGVDAISSEEAAEVRQTMKSLEEVAISKLVLPSAKMHTTQMNLNHEFAAAIVLPIREHRSEWRNAALEASKAWTKWDAKDYAAFCRYHGSHTTENIGYRNWNEELTSPMRRQLGSNWGFFEETIEESQKDLVDSVYVVFDELCAPLQDNLTSYPSSLQTLLTTLPYRRSTISHIIATSLTDLLEETQQLESDALYGHTSSYINTLMAPAYHEASALSASPSFLLPSAGPTPPHSPSPSLLDQQRKDLIATHIASTRIFPKLSTMIEKSHRALVKAAFDEMIEGVTREVDALIRDLNLVVLGEGEQSEAQRYAEFARGLTGRIARAGEVVKEGMQVVEDVRAFYFEGSPVEQ